MGCLSDLVWEMDAPGNRLLLQLITTQSLHTDITHSQLVPSSAWLNRFFFSSFRFFEVNPEYQKLFPEFKSVALDDLEKTNALYGHAKRVMKAVENAVSSMEDAETFSAYLEELGRRHKTRALKPTYLDVSSSLFCTACYLAVLLSITQVNSYDVHQQFL